MDVVQDLLNLTSMTVGCTDVGAIGYAAAIAREALKAEPESIRIILSDEIYKNAKNVGVPGSGRRGPMTAALLGTVICQPARKLAIFHEVAECDLEAMADLERKVDLSLVHQKCPSPMWVRIEMSSGGDEIQATLAFKYDYVYQLKLNGRDLINKAPIQSDAKVGQALDLSTMIGLVETIDQASPALLDRIRVNVDPIDPMPGAMEAMIIALHRKVYLTTGKRMRGEVLPIVSFCGSGNLGIASANAIDALTRFYKSDPVTATRAAVLYLLIVRAIKDRMTLLTVMCGSAIAAGAAAAGVNLYLKGCAPSLIHLAVNQALSESLGVICDGAKENCAAKTASRVLEGILESEYVAENLGITGEQGVIASNTDETIRRISTLNNQDMEALNQAILEMI